MTTCKNCGKAVHYSPDDVVYLHDNREWGEDWSIRALEAGTYNNRYFCDESRTKAADGSPVRVDDH